MICSECNGSGKYNPLIGPAEDCRACNGTGNVLANGGGMIPAEYATGGVVTENMVLGSAAARRDKYVWLAQRWDATQFGLIAGQYYMHELGCHPVPADDTRSPHCNTLSFSLDIDHRTLEVYRLEFPSRGFKMHLPGDRDYDKMRNDYGSNPCVERGNLFIGFNATVGCQVEFFASEDTMGIAFVTEFSSYRFVTLGTRFEAAAGLYLPTIVHGKP
jgi:hypothetical protein